MRSMYGRRRTGQSQGVITRPAVGLNSYTPSTELNDNFMSDMLDVSAYKNEAILFDVERSRDNAHIMWGYGRVLASQPLHGSIDYRIALLIVDVRDTTYHIKIIDYFDKAEDDSQEITGILDHTTGEYYDSCLFFTEADRHVCFISDVSKTLIVYEYENTEELTTVTLPFTPKRMTSHANRIFIIDTSNKVWWCRAGDFRSWYGVEYDDDMIVTDRAMANVALTIASQPDVPRVITATCTAVGDPDTLGSLTLVGTDTMDNAIEQVLTLAHGRVQTTFAFKTVGSATISGWVAAGTADRITVGVGPIGSGYVQDDAGFWTIEKEQSLEDLAVIGKMLYLFAEDSIYGFYGYSPETFALSEFVTNMGIHTSPKKKITIMDNRAYFLKDKEIYEFDGERFPRVITRSVTVNGALTNGIMGGIELDSNDYGLVATNRKLFVYPDNESTWVDGQVYYRLDREQRSWWKFSGWSYDSITNPVYRTIMFSSDYEDKVLSIRFTTQGVGATWTMTETGYQYGDAPYIVTKAYNTNPSELGTLSDIILLLQGTKDETATIKVSYSLSSVADDFVLVKEYVDYIYTGDVETITIPMPIAYISNAHHYRLKIEATSGSLILYNIERRFRVRGRSR